VVLGIGSYLNDFGGVLAQLQRARALHPLGVALYSYAVPTSDLADPPSDGDVMPARDEVATQLRFVFPRPAPVPDLAWLSHPTLGGLLVEAQGQDGARVTLSNGAGVQRTWRTDGTGVAGSFDLPPGRYSVSLGASVLQVDVRPGAVSVVRY
jgi:hypothetical protein